MLHPTAPSGGQRLTRGVSLGVLVSANVVLMASTSAPSPIYPLYLERWGLSVTTMTGIFAVYVVGLVGALLAVGSLSDRIGRRPVVISSLLMAAAGTALFWAADGAAALALARVVQGLATGTAAGALAAGLVEFSPAGRADLGPAMTAVGIAFGLALGGGSAGLLVQVSARPDDVVFPVLTVTFLILALLVYAVPETAARRSTGSVVVRPSIRIPRETRRGFRAALPAIVAGWSTTGLFLALAPSLVRDVMHVRWGAAGGLSITVLFVANSGGGLWAARMGAQRATLVGALLLSAGAASVGVALVSTSPAVFIGGAIVSGLGVGLTFTGTLNGISEVTGATSRAEVFSAAYVVSYAALGVPALAAGVASQFWGLRTTGYAYVAFIAALSVVAACHPASTLRHCRRTPLEPESPTARARRGVDSHRETRKELV